MKKIELIEEQVNPEKRLGRHIEHDERSKEYAYSAVAPTLEFKDLVSVVHRRFGGVLNQGNVGSCTGNATAHAVNTQGIHKPHRVLHEKDALGIYELATQLDDVAGTYPPDDTGSSGLAAAKAASQKGYISEYRHAFSLLEALTALQDTPVIVGIGWYESFDNPSPNGDVVISGQIRGGHEICLLGFERANTLEASMLVFQNSWGVAWGRHGQFQMAVSSFERLLSEQGDVTILLP